MYIYHEIITVKDINDKEEILETLSNVETDEDFNGNNGEEFTREIALENGFDTSQDYVVDKLRKSNLTGEDLIIAFFKEWLDGDCYYDQWDFESDEKENGAYTCSVVATHRG